MSELLDCPFCGRAMGFGDHCSSSIGAAISCARCEASTGWMDTLAEAKVAWNRRTPQPVTPAGGEVEPVGEVYTMQAVVPGCGVRYHATISRPLPDGTKLYTHPPVADAALPRGHRVDDGKQLAMIRDAERLDWLEQVAFTTYRTRDPETGRLYSHVTFVNEDEAPRRGITRDSFREAIDAAMQDAALNQRGGGDHG